MTFQQTGTAPQAKTPAISAPEKEITVHDIARACYDAAKGDVERAARIMQRKVQNDSALLAQLSEEFIRITCVDTVGSILRRARRLTWLAPNYDAGGKGGRVRHLAEGNKEMLMQFPLPGGKPLGEANADEVREASDLYGKQSKDMGHKARWLALIAARLPKNKTVR